MEMSPCWRPTNEQTREYIELIDTWSWVSQWYQFHLAQWVNHDNITNLPKFEDVRFSSFRRMLQIKLSNCIKYALLHINSYLKSNEKSPISEYPGQVFEARWASHRPDGVHIRGEGSSFVCLKKIFLIILSRSTTWPLSPCSTDWLLRRNLVRTSQLPSARRTQGSKYINH